MQAVLIKAEALACVQLIVLALVADDGLALQGGEDGVAGCAVRGQAGTLVKGHQHELHVVGVDEVEIGNAAFLIGNEVLQRSGLACFEDAVHGKSLLFQNDFSVDHAGVGAGAAQLFHHAFHYKNLLLTI